MRIPSMRHGVKLSNKQFPNTDEELKRMRTFLILLLLVPKEGQRYVLGDDDDAKSQSGSIFKLNDGVVAWKNSKQESTTDSTTEAKYIAALEATEETVWMKNYIQELGVVTITAKLVLIFCDNNRVAVQVKEPISH
ncbi:UNVERIFIED_CONTAM: Retrovirus-related Pol polyprotein from transposon TNT 1-94 [Sesamum indicum]